MARRKRTGRAYRYSEAIGKIFEMHDDLEEMEAQLESLQRQTEEAGAEKLDDVPELSEMVKQFNKLIEDHADGSEIECLRDELESWYENMPENFQNGSKGDMLQDAISELENAMELVDSLSQLNVTEDGKEGKASEKDIAEALAEQVEEALNILEELESTEPEFPGMFG